MGEVEDRRPGANRMRACATAFVTHATARNRLPLDYSVASLRVVDFLIDGLRKGGAGRERDRKSVV